MTADEYLAAGLPIPLPCRFASMSENGIVIYAWTHCRSVTDCTCAVHSDDQWEELYPGYKKCVRSARASMEKVR